MKRFFCLLAVLIFFGSAEPLAAISSFKDTRADQDLLEKPKPGSKRWHRQQRHVRNTRRKKYPRMKRGGQAEWGMIESQKQGRNREL